MKKVKNGEVKSALRKYDSLQGWVGKNPIEEAGTLIHVSTKGNEEYDVTLTADGKSTFNQLWKRYKETGNTGSGGGSGVSKDEVEDIVEDILDGENLTEEERRQQEEQDSADWNNIFNKAMEDAQNAATQEAGAASGEASDCGESAE